MKSCELLGQTFGRLTVISRAGSNTAGQALWMCQCSCGGTARTTSGKLNGGHTRSCGCIKIERISKIRRISKPLGKCAVNDCEELVSSSGVRYCKKHDARFRRNGHPNLTRRENGRGSINDAGYVDMGVNGRRQYEHILIAEKALGKPLPGGAVVHHANGKKSDNRPCNLVICPSTGYHSMLHKRMKQIGVPNT